MEGELEAGDCSAAIVFDFSSDEENGLSSKRRLFGVMAGDVLSSRYEIYLSGDKRCSSRARATACVRVCTSSLP